MPLRGRRDPATGVFLVSFLVDARGGSMNGSRCRGLRIVIPPNAASAPTRVTCRLMRQGRVSRPPQLNDGEGLACRILEMGPTSAKFNSHVLLEVPHFASLREREREIIVYKSETGDTWKEHTVEVTEQAVQSAVGGFFGPLESNEELRKKRVVRILTDSFPQYFALVTRIRQESALIGPEGGVISSTVVSQVQAVFPEGALTKKIRVGIQAQPVGAELVNKLLGARVAVSPVVTIEPRRRKFHKPITLTIPLPRPATRGVTSPGESPTLRLLCSITGGPQPATWEDITGSTPLSYVKDCVSFTTTVSARFWLMDCPNTSESAEMASRLYRDSFVVPYMGHFAIFAKRHDPDEAKLRCFCVTDDKVEKTLECNEGFELKAESREFEVLDGKPQWIEGVANLQPITKSGEQLFLPFKAFRENRLAFTVRLKDPSQPPIGKIAFLKDPRPTKPTDSPSLKPICTLEVELPDFRQEGGPRPQRLPQDPTPLSFADDRIARSELDLRDIADALRSDWTMLASELGVAQSDVTNIKVNFRDERDRALALLCQWQREKGDRATGNELERCLRRIGREDVVKKCMRNVEYVVEETERRQAKTLLDDDGDDDDGDAGDDKGDDEPGVGEEAIVASVGDAGGPRPAKTKEEKEADKRAKTEAFLSLIEAMDQMTPEPVVHRRESDAGGDPVAEDDITAVSRDDIQKEPEPVEEQMTSLDSKLAESMAPEADTPEEEMAVPLTAPTTHAELPSAGTALDDNSPLAEQQKQEAGAEEDDNDDTPPPTPVEGIPEEDIKRQARDFVEEFMKREEGSLQDEPQYTQDPEASGDGDGHQHSVSHKHELLHGEPQEFVEEEEFEEELEDGTIVKKRVVRRRVVQEVTERIVTEGCADEVLRRRGDPDTCLGHHEAPYHPELEGGLADGEERVEEEEEVLPDGTVVKRRVVTRRSHDVRVLHDEQATCEEEEEDQQPGNRDSLELRQEAGRIVSDAIRGALDGTN